MRVYLVAGFQSYGDGGDIGMFSMESDSGSSCEAFGDDMENEMPTALKISRAFGITGYVFHSMAMLTVITLEAGCAFKSSTILWTLVRFCVIASMLCSIMLFASFFQELCSVKLLGAIGLTCAPGPVGVIAIINVFVLVVLIVVSRKTDAPTKPIFRATKEETVPAARLEEAAADVEIKGGCVNDQSMPSTGAELKSPEVDV